MKKKKVAKDEATAPVDFVLPREIWVLVAAAVCIALGYGIVAPVLPKYARDFGVSTTAATVVVSSFAFMRLVFAPATGHLATWLGERKLYLAGIFIVAASSLASAFAGSYWQLLVMRGLGGVGSIMFTVAAMSLIIELAPKYARGRASAAYGSGFLIGGIAGPAVGGLLAGLGYRWPFIIYAGTLLLALAIVAVMIPGSQAKRRKIRKRAEYESDTHVGEQTAKLESRQKQAVLQTSRETLTVGQALRISRFRLIVITSFVQGWANLGMRNAIVPLFTATIVVGPSWAPAGEWLAGGALTAYAVGNGLALLRAGRWADEYGRRLVIMIGLALAGILTIALGFSTTTVGVLLICVLGGIGTGFIQPGQQGALADIVAEKQGSRVVSFFQQSGDLGAIFGPIIAGLIVDHAGFVAAYVVAGVVLILAAVMWLLSQQVADGADSEVPA